VTSAGWVGGLIGYHYEGTITDCASDITINSSGGNYAGGFVGLVNAGTIEGSESHGTMNVETQHSGGLEGFLNGFTTLSHSSSSVTMNGGNNSSAIGGLVGRLKGTVSDSYATGDVTGAGTVGGLAGYCRYCEIVDSFASGVVSGDDLVGGLVGHISGTSSVSRSFATGDVNYALGATQVGGFAGASDSGTVSGSAYLNSSLNCVGSGSDPGTECTAEAISYFNGTDIFDRFPWDQSVWQANTGYPTFIEP